MHWSANKFATQFKCLAHAFEWKKIKPKLLFCSDGWLKIHQSPFKWLSLIFVHTIYLFWTFNTNIWILHSFDMHQWRSNFWYSQKKTNWKHFPVLANYLVLLLFCTKRERWTETAAQNARAFPNICFWAFLIIIYWIHSLVCRVKVFNWIQNHSKKERDIKIEREKAWNISVDTA